MNNVHEAILYVKENMDGIGKDNQGHAYKYRSHEQILEELRPLLIQAGLNITCSNITPFDSKNDKVDSFLFTWEIHHKESDSFEVYHSIGAGSARDEKGVGSAMTYGHKNMLLKLFEIVSDDDPDHHQPVTQRNTEPVNKRPFSPSKIKLIIKQGAEGLISNNQPFASPEESSEVANIIQDMFDNETAITVVEYLTTDRNGTAIPFDREGAYYKKLLDWLVKDPDVAKQEIELIMKELE